MFRPLVAHIAASLVASLLLTALLSTLLFGASACSGRHDLPDAVQAIASFDRGKATPVSQGVLNLNPKRKIAGISIVEYKWTMAKSVIVIMDGPTFTVLLDENGIPKKVISQYPGSLGSTEYSILEGKLSGKAVIWSAQPSDLVFESQTYSDNHRNGTTDYFGKEGQIISSCEFRNDKPWTGRVLARNNFDQLQWDVSYQDGVLDGAQWSFDVSTGKPDRLKTFQMGVLHGPSRIYHDGYLRYDEFYENDILRLRDAWHDNGQIEWHEEFDINGEPTGTRRQWNREGVVILEENYRNGQYHGRRFLQGQGELWWWKNKTLRDEAEFDALAENERNKLH
jgi:antitoxin component YwqK of YwqJK toxin-antitoxin module